MSALTSRFISRDDALHLHVAYFDTSAWNKLADDPRRELIVAKLQRSGVIAPASVISAGEILKTPDQDRIQRLT